MGQHSDTLLSNTLNGIDMSVGCHEDEHEHEHEHEITILKCSLPQFRIKYFKTNFGQYRLSSCNSQSSKTPNSLTFAHAAMVVMKRNYGRRQGLQKAITFLYVRFDGEKDKRIRWAITGWADERLRTLRKLCSWCTWLSHLLDPCNRARYLAKTDYFFGDLITFTSLRISRNIRFQFIPPSNLPSQYNYMQHFLSDSVMYETTDVKHSKFSPVCCKCYDITQQ
uniref:Uncharacterized protein n=1 Tax=Glossina austeni TaxID=7395 RepID=A0A1A9VN53_GLOAU